MARFYGWAHHEIMNLAFPVFLGYVEQMSPIQKAEYRMQLAVATNPHTKSEDQRKLWRQLEEVPTHVVTKRMSKDRKAQAAKVMESLKHDV